MLFRSSNSKFTHHQGDFISNVDDGSSHGVHLTGGSTGGIVQSAGDEDNIALNVRGKGTGPTVIGNSSAAVRIGTSTSSIQSIQRYLVQWTVPAMGAGATNAQTTVTVTGLTTNSVLTLQARVQVNSSVPGITLYGRCSTTDELVIDQSKHGESSISGSTQSAYLLQHDF